jgi:hypothetical protein
LHCPFAEQLSEIVGSQAEQAVPATPQLANAGVLQFAPAQHPFGQLEAVHPVHTPAALQIWLAGHAEHAVPPLPQAPLSLPDSHVLPLQQPLGQEVPLHTQTPPTQTCPVPHAAPVPQAHAPEVVHRLAWAPQATQAAPPVPHAPVDGVSQTLPWQQPVGQDVALQTQLPPTHAWPTAHCGPLPQEQAPLAQESDRFGSQATQLTPNTPHADCVGVVHVPFEQQPRGQDAALHTQVPPTHAWPAAHGAPLPHRHCPVAEQLSDVRGSQAVHAPPPMPHAASDLVLHVGPEQQPLVHVDAHPAQAPETQGCVPGQGVHVLPPLPQAEALLPG